MARQHTPSMASHTIHTAQVDKMARRPDPAVVSRRSYPHHISSHLVYALRQHVSHLVEGIIAEHSPSGL